jgi:hypothetical protein
MDGWMHWVVHESDRIRHIATNRAPYPYSLLTRLVFYDDIAFEDGKLESKSTIQYTFIQ